MSSAPMEKSAVEPISHQPACAPTGEIDVEYHWQGGNRVELRENGEEYFPRVFAASGRRRVKSCWIPSSS